jgi:hypothetical protein
MSEPANESPALDAEDWNIVFEAYDEYPVLAFILAQHLAHVKELIQGGHKAKAESLAALDRAIESLMPRTNFRDAGRKVYLLAVAGELSHEQEEMIDKLRLTTNAE